MLTLLFLLMVITILCFFYIYWTNQNYFKFWKERNVKFLNPTPIFGSILPLLLQRKSSAEFINDLYKSFPDEKYFGFYKFGTPILMIRDPELCKTVTIKNFESFHDHGDMLKAKSDVLWNRSLFSAEGSRWRALRQVMSPVFTSSKLKMMFGLMEECAKNFVQHFENISQPKNNIIEVEMKDAMSRYTNDVIASVAFGVKCDSLKNRDNEFLKYGRSLVDFTGLKRFKFFLFAHIPRIEKLLNFKIISPKVGDFFTSVMDETIKARDNLKIARADLIHLLMGARNEQQESKKNQDIDSKSQETSNISNEDITAQAIIFYFGGFDAVSNALGFIVHELAINPDIQSKLREEIIKTQKNEQISYEIIMEMKYLHNFINEVVRKYPTGVWLDRKCTKDIEISTGEHTLKIHAGDIVWIPIYGIHHDPQYYPNPEQIDPDRFSIDGGFDMATFLAFGAGPRGCLGYKFAQLEIKIMLVHLLTKFEIVPVQKTEIPLTFKKDAVILLANKGVHLGIKRLP